MELKQASSANSDRGLLSWMAAPQPQQQTATKQGWTKAFQEEQVRMPRQGYFTFLDAPT